MASPISSLTGSSATSGATASAAAAASTAAANPVNEQVFLKLLVAQIQNQDPMNPTDGTQFVSQLAQFSELEQVIAIRGDTDNMESQMSAASTAAAASSAAASTSTGTNSDSTTATGGTTPTAGTSTTTN